MLLRFLGRTLTTLLIVGEYFITINPTTVRTIPPTIQPLTGSWKITAPVIAPKAGEIGDKGSS